MHAPQISKINVRRLTSEFLLMIIIFSMILFVPPATSDSPQGNNVSWESQDDTTQNSWDWTNQGWQFGPFPTFTVILENGTEITNDNYVPLDQQFTVRMDIQKSIFVGNATLGQAGLYWGTDLRSQNGSITGSASCNMMYVNDLQGQGWNQSNIWNIYSNVYNQSLTNEVKDPPQPQPIQQVGFFQFNSEASNITESDMGWRVYIVGTFNSSTPMGPYWVNMQITDQYNNWIDVYSQSGSDATNRQIAVGRGGFVFGGYQDYYTFEKVDMQNNPLMSVTKGAKWKMRLNVTSSDFDNATIGLNLPWNIQQYVNVTGWYEKVITENGGWMFNETSSVYYWNSSAVVTRTQQVYGPHLEQRWTSLTNSNHPVNRTYTMWNPVTNENEVVSEVMYVQDQLFLMFNQETETFSIKIGYSYDSYDVNTQRYVQYQVLNDLNETDLTSQFYSLSLSDCRYYQTAPNKHVVEFAGIFSNSTNYDQDQYYLQLNVFTGTQQIWANWEETDQTDMQVVVDRPVAVSTVLDSHGDPARTQSMFMISQSKPFSVESNIYGCSQVYQDMDAIGVSFYSNFGSWSETENSNSQVEIRLTKNLNTNAISSVSYNRTNVNKYVYGSHLGWAYVNVTDWHTEYNSTTGMWDWVESPHLIWNQTTLNDWHWEYYRLNQTEYAIAPNSPNIWIDTTTCYIDDMDPAFIMPTSYATLNSANMTLVEGIVVVDLGVTFDSSAPQGNYWYNMIFQTMTYGQDPSQGWGQHRITEWTSESIYYINSDATGNENWLVSTPSTPLYTIYNAQRYQVSQAPYITINDHDYLIKPQVQYDQAQQRDWTQYLLTGTYDPSIGRQTRYYELQNGTKIYVDQAYQTIIRTLQLATPNAYKFVGDSKIALANGTSIATYMIQATPDYSKQYWNPGQGNILPYYYEQLNGSRVYYDGNFEQSAYNSTTDHWEMTNKIYTESDQTLLVESAGSGVKLNNTIVLLRDPGYWQTLPDGTGYYLVMQNGTRIIVANPYNVPDDQRLATINGATYIVGWPNQYYQATYNAQNLLIPYNGPNNDYYVQSYFYTDLSVNGGEMHELPYPGAMATSWWDLEGIESSGQKLKTLKTITVDGTEVLLNFDGDTQTYYIEVGSERQTVTYPTVDNNNFYASINGEDSWDVTQNGWTVDYGAYSMQSWQLTSEGSLSTTTGYDPIAKSWSANRYGYDYENSTLYLTMPNGTRLDVSSTMTLAVWRVDVNGETYYTTDCGSNTESVMDNSGQSVFRNYFTALNGNKVYFDWDNPANWVQEIHVPITGTNYTKLIPYTWQSQSVFDKVVIYNITIPEIGTTGHTGVYFQDGTEVAPNTAFKVIGSTYGPGTCYSFSQNGNTYNFDGAYIPSTQAPWNGNISVGYCITLDGSRLYSPAQFGWNGNIYGNPWNTEKQWTFNGDAESANRTVSVVEGGYAIYLNKTIKVDVTTNNIFGDSNGNYVVMTNGTRVEVQWLSSLSSYFTVINGEKYLFQSVITYNILTDGGVTYSIADPLVYDQRHLYTPSTYQAPVASTDSNSYLNINATTSSILHDETGYYFINAQDQSRIDLTLVDDWWALPEIVRDQVFTNQQSDYYPRYNITINGVEYFVIDPSPVVDRWNGEWSIQNAMYRYSNTVTTELGGVTYTITLYQPGFSWFNNLTIRQTNTITIDGTTYDVAEQYSWKPSYQVSINNQTVPIESNTMNIYKTHESWGNIYTWRLTDLGISTTSQVGCLIVGTPQFGMWGIRAYKVVESSGAVDLDGDTTSSQDQYFVRRVHTGEESETSTTKRMLVDVDWNPNSNLVGDDIQLSAWMGQLQVSWTSQWTESYVWYRASDMSPVDADEMLQISNTIVNNETQQPNPGYWDIAHMVRNQTWEDVLAQAEANGWDWINSNQNDWNWLWFGTDQNYNVDVLQNGLETTAGVDLKYEFAGLNILNGTEQTHYFMPKNVGNVSFVTPGEAFGDYNASGSMMLPLNSKVDFGVTYTDVNGTFFPYNEQRSMWGWWDRPIYGADFNAPNLMNKPTEASADYLQFLVHFAGNQTDSQYNSASMKIDQWIGDWDLPTDVVDGRTQNSSGVMVPLVGNEVMQNRSLALNYYVTASTSMGWTVKDDKGSSVSNNGVTNSSQFNVASQLNDVNFASVKLGSTYDWGKPTTATDQIRTFNVTSQTTSIQNFQSSYQSDAGKSSTGFDISSSMYFLTQGFPRWDGYSIYNDPEVSVLVSKGTAPTEPTPSPTVPPNNPTPSPTNSPSGSSGTSSSGSSASSGSSNPAPTTNPDNHNTNPTPQNTATPPPNYQTPKPTESTPPTEIPSTIILIAVAVVAGVVIGSLALVRVKKKK